jgi:hypothetical protein
VHVSKLPLKLLSRPSKNKVFHGANNALRVSIISYFPEPFGVAIKENIMFRIITTVSALALTAIAIPAFAQTTSPSGGMPNTGSIQETQVPPSSPPMSQPAPEPAPAPAPESSAPAPDPAASKAAAVKEVVEAEFPTYDADKNASLSKVEFTKWVTALREKSDASQGKTEKMPAPEMAKWTTSAFAAADKDKSKKVTKEEMMAFLQG